MLLLKEPGRALLMPMEWLSAP
jgi:hypothetical protein